MLAGTAAEIAERAGPARVDVLAVPHSEQGKPSQRRRDAHARTEAGRPQNEQRAHALWACGPDCPALMKHAPHATRWPVDQVNRHSIRHRGDSLGPPLTGQARLVDAATVRRQLVRAGVKILAPIA